MDVIDESKLANAQVTSDPYPYLVIDNVLLSDVAEQITRDFPALDKGGSFPLNAVSVQGPLSTLIADLNSDTFRRNIENLFNIELNQRPSTVTLRGYSRAKDGRIHTDSKSKLITVLIYFNEPWTAETGRLRVLRDGQSLEDYAAEVAPNAGTCIIFKVTENCWHGYPAYEGLRQSLQFNYVVSDAAAEHNITRHRFSAFLKKLFRCS